MILRLNYLQHSLVYKKKLDQIGRAFFYFFEFSISSANWFKYSQRSYL